MVKDQSKYFTIFQPDIKSYLSIMIFPSLDLVDHLIHEVCANHEEALARAKERYAAAVGRSHGHGGTLVPNINSAVVVLRMAQE